jgi:hypothetical protein
MGKDSRELIKRLEDMKGSTGGRARKESTQRRRKMRDKRQAERNLDVEREIQKFA